MNTGTPRYIIIPIIGTRKKYAYVRRPWGACWMVAEGGEGENPLPFSLTTPKRGGRGGIPASFPSGPHLRSSRFSRHPRLRLRGLGGFCGEKAPGPWWAGPQALGARAPSPLETWPTGPCSLDLTSSLPASRVF